MPTAPATDTARHASLIRERAERFAAAEQARQPHITARDRSYLAGGYEAGFADGAASGDAAPVIRAARGRERERIAAILALPEAPGRDQMAHHLAFATDSTADQAKALLVIAPQSHRGLLDPAQDALLAAAVEGAGLPAQSVLSLAMKAEAGAPVRSQPGTEAPPAGGRSTPRRYPPGARRRRGRAARQIRDRQRRDHA